MNKGNKIAILIVIIFVIAKILYLYHTDMIGDEYLHYIIPKYMLEHGKIFLLGEEIIPYKWSYRPPAYHMVLVPFVYLFSAESIRYLSIVWNVITTYFLYKLFYKYDQTGIIASLSHFNFINFFYSSSGLWEEPFSVMLLIMTIYYYFKDKNYWIITFIIASFTKIYFSFGLIPIFLYHSFFHKKNPKKFFIVLLMVIPFLAYYLMIINLSSIRSYGVANPFPLDQHWGNAFFNFTFGKLSLIMISTHLLLIFSFLYFLEKKQYKYWICGMSFYIFYLAGVEFSPRRFLPSGLFTMFLLYLALTSKRFKIFRSVAIGVLILFLLSNIFIIIKNTNYNCPYLSIFENLIFDDNYNCLYPPLKESFSFIRTLPDDARIFSPFPLGTYYHTNKTVVYFDVQKDYPFDHILIMKTWFRRDFFYKQVFNFDLREELFNKRKWEMVYENEGIEIYHRLEKAKK